jgi:hypothetical protein
MPPRRRNERGAGGSGKQEALPAPPAVSPADAALAVADAAAHVVAVLMGAAHGTAEDLARAECVCTALRRAAAPHWRALCCTLSSAVVRRTAASVDDHARWRRLYRQLHAASFLVPDARCACADFLFLVDVTHKGASLFSACMGPFTGVAHVQRRVESHELVATAAEGAPESAPPRVTAGDLYDWPKHFRARVYAQRCADGALAAVMLDVQPDAPIANEQGGDDDDSDDELHIPLTMGALTFSGFLPLVPTTGSEGEAPPVYLRLFMEAEDSYGFDANAEPLFFRQPGYRCFRDEPPAGGGGHRPRLSKQETKERRSGYVPDPDQPCDLPIERAALARPVVLRRADCAATLNFGYGRMDCFALCTELDMLNFI